MVKLISVGLNYDILKEVENDTESPNMFKSLMFINKLVDEIDAVIEKDLTPTK